MMPVFFLSTGLKTNWTLGGATVFVVAGALLLAAVAANGLVFKWQERFEVAKGEASIIALGKPRF